MTSNKPENSRTHLVLIRHGQTDWNVEGRYQGHNDLPLNATGRAQAGALADQLAGQSFKAIYSSDLRRAYETASIIADRLGLPVRIDERLKEIDLGEWEGMLFSDIMARYPAEWGQRQHDPAYSCPPGGETPDALSTRVGAALDEIARRHTPGPVIIVSHGLALATAMCRAQSLPVAKVFDVTVRNAFPIEVDWPCA